MPLPPSTRILANFTLNILLIRIYLIVWLVLICFIWCLTMTGFSNNWKQKYAAHKIFSSGFSCYSFLTGMCIMNAPVNLWTGYLPHLGQFWLSLWRILLKYYFNIIGYVRTEVTNSPSIRHIIWLRSFLRIWIRKPFTLRRLTGNSQ